MILKKIISIFLTVTMLSLCCLLFACDRINKDTDTSNSSNNEDSVSDNITSDLDSDKQDDIQAVDYSKKLFSDIEAIKKNIEENKFITDTSEIEDFLSIIKNADFEISDFKGNDENELANMSKIIFKDSSLYATNQDGTGSIYARLGENEIVLLTTKDGKTTMKNIPIEISISDETEIELDISMLFTKDDLSATVDNNRYKLKDEYVDSLIDGLVELTKSQELSYFKGTQVYLNLEKYDLGIIGVEISSEILGEYSASINLSGLIYGSGSLSFELYEGKEQLFNLHIELNEYMVEAIALDLEYNECNIFVSATNDSLDVTVKTQTDTIKASFSQANSDIEGLYDYVIKLEATGKELDDGIIEIEAKANSKTDNGLSYLIYVTLTDKDGESGGTATLYSPSKSEIKLSEDEAKYLSRYDIYLQNKAVIDERAINFVSNGIIYFQQNRSALLDLHKNLTKYYYYDEEFDVVYLTTFEYNIINDLLNYTINIVCDYENHLYFAHEVVADYKNAENSQYEIELKAFYDDACKAYENQVSKYYNMGGDYYHYAYYYNKEQNIYLVVKIENESSSTYRTEKPSMKEFMGELCEIKYVDGEAVYHSLEFTGYDQRCRKLFKCSECGDELRGLQEEHDTVNELISEANDKMPKVTSDSCTRCGMAFVHIGSQFTMRLEKATEQCVSGIASLLGNDEITTDKIDSYYEITSVIINEPLDGMSLEIPRIDKYNVIAIRKFADIENTEKVHFSKVTLHEGIYSIGYEAFIEEKIDEIDLPLTLVNISTRAFEKCIFEKFVVPVNVKSLGVCFIDYNEQLKDLIVDCEYLESFTAPKYCDSLDNIQLNGTVRLINFGNANVKEYTVKKGTESITFAYNKYIERVVIPNEVGPIEFSFPECKNLKTVILPYGITEIESGTFHQCDSLENLVIPNTVTKIGMYAFYGIDNLVLTIPESVTEIEHQAFFGSNMKITYEGTKEQWDAMNVYLHKTSVVICTKTEE